MLKTLDNSQLNWNRAIHVVLTRLIAAASTVHFDSIFIVQHHSAVSSVPSIVLAPIPTPSEHK